MLLLLLFSIFFSSLLGIGAGDLLFLIAHRGSSCHLFAISISVGLLLFLGVHCVGQICTIEGTSFLPGILEGDDYQLDYQATLMKLHQEKPGRRAKLDAMKKVTENTHTIS